MCQYTGMLIWVMAVHSAPRYSLLCFQSFQGLKIWATEEPISGAWTGSGAPMYDPWVLSTPLRSDLFLESTDYHNPTEKHGQSLALPWEGEPFYQKIKEITPTTVWMEESISESLHLEGHVYFQAPLQRYTASRLGWWTQILSFLKQSSQSVSYPTHHIICIWGQCPHWCWVAKTNI